MPQISRNDVISLAFCLLLEDEFDVGPWIEFFDTFKKKFSLPSARDLSLWKRHYIEWMNGFFQRKALSSIYIDSNYFDRPEILRDFLRPDWKRASEKLRKERVKKKGIASPIEQEMIILDLAFSFVFKFTGRPTLLDKVCYLTPILKDLRSTNADYEICQVVNAQMKYVFKNIDDCYQQVQRGRIGPVKLDNKWYFRIERGLKSEQYVLLGSFKILFTVYDNKASGSNLCLDALMDIIPIPQYAKFKIDSRFKQCLKRSACHLYTGEPGLWNKASMAHIYRNKKIHKKLSLVDGWKIVETE